MGSRLAELLQPDLFMRGRTITAVARWTALAASLLVLAWVWRAPRTRPGVYLAIAFAYAIFTAINQFTRRRRGAALKLQAVVDALALGAGSAVSGGLASPLWLLLYPHAVGFSVAGRLRFGAAIGLLDAAIVWALSLLTPDPGLGPLHALTLLCCAAMGGMTSTYLRSVQRALHASGRDLAASNRQLTEALDVGRAGQREQAEALAHLRASEERLRRLIERIQDGLLILQDGRIAYANTVFATMAGASLEAVVGADFLDFVPAEDRPELWRRYAAWEEGQTQAANFEVRLQRPSGETRLASLRAGWLEFEGCRSVIATLRDITRERRMEQEVKAHAERLAAINEIANAVNLSLTIEDILAVAGEETRRLLAFDRLTITLIDDAGASLEVLAVGSHTLRQRPSFGPEAVAWAFRRPSAWCEGGDEQPPPHLRDLLGGAPVLATATVPLLNRERVIGCLALGRVKPVPFSTRDLGVVEPVTRHLAIALGNARLLEALRRRSREFESVLEIGHGILQRLDLAELLPLVTRSVNDVMGTQHCILMLRDGESLRVAAQEGLESEVLTHLGTLRMGQSLSGWVAQQARPLAIADFHSDARAEFKDVAIRYGYCSYLGVPLVRGSEVLGTLEVITKQQRRFDPEEQELMAVFASQAAVALDNARLFDNVRSQAARLAEANRRLEDLDRLRQEYLRNVSHEFRTPLTVIRGYAEYLIDAPAQEPAALRDVMRIVMESCDRVIDMVDTLIEVSRIEQGLAGNTLQVQRLDLRELTEACVNPLRAQAGRKRVDLALEFPAEPLQLEADPGLLHQAIRKLVDNALKYSPTGGRVVIRGAGDGDATALEVEDFGVGIAPEHQDRIFEKFYMVDGGISRRMGGTGVGLYLVQEIVRLHGGSLDLRSQPGLGSCFSLRLPRVFQGAGRASTQA